MSSAVLLFLQSSCWNHSVTAVDLLTVLSIDTKRRGMNAYLKCYAEHKKISCDLGGFTHFFMEVHFFLTLGTSGSLSDYFRKSNCYLSR